MLNKVILMGRLTRDPELKYTSSNIPVCSFRLRWTGAFPSKAISLKPILSTLWPGGALPSSFASTSQREGL